MKYIKEYKEIDFDDWDEEEDTISDEFRGHKKFYNFLVDNDILDKWLYNFEHDYRNQEGVRTIRKFLLNNSENYLNNCFNWEGTEERHAYWERFNTKWEDIVRDSW